MDTQLATDGLIAAGGSAEAFGILLASEVARWGGLGKTKGIKLD